MPVLVQQIQRLGIGNLMHSGPIGCPFPIPGGGLAGVGKHRLRSVFARFPPSCRLRSPTRPRHARNAPGFSIHCFAIRTGDQLDPVILKMNSGQANSG